MQQKEKSTPEGLSDTLFLLKVQVEAVEAFRGCRMSKSERLLALAELTLGSPLPAGDLVKALAFCSCTVPPMDRTNTQPLRRSAHTLLQTIPVLKWPPYKAKLSADIDN